MAVRLSVIIPCYNMGDFVLEAINSVLEFPDQSIVEIIVINDGSNDNGYTKKVLDTFECINLKVVHQNNQGLAKARNNAIKLSKGDYVLPLDADNKIRPNYIFESIKLLDKNPEIGICYANLEYFGLENKIVNVGDFDISKILIKNYIDACVVLRKTALASVKGYDENMPVMGYEDWDLNLRLFFKGWEFKYINKTLFDYRKRKNSMLLISNRNRELLLEYIFSKPDLQQAKILREKILNGNHYKTTLEGLKKRKIIAFALTIERPVKKFYRLIKGL